MSASSFVTQALSSAEVMNTLKPGEHGSTFGGNPLACAVALESLKVIQDEGLAENAHQMGNLFRQRLSQIKHSNITEVRGKGLLNAMVVQPWGNGKTAYDLCLALLNNGLLAKQTHEHIIRFAPPLIIQANEVNQCCDIIEKTIFETIA